MRKNLGKKYIRKAAYQIGAFSIMFVILFAALSLADAHSPPETFPTQLSIKVSPSVIGIGQTLIVTTGLNEPPPTANGTYGDRWGNVTVSIIQPDNTSITLGPFFSDPYGQVYVAFTPTQVGNHTFQASFGGQVIAGKNPAPGSDNPYIGDYYQPSKSALFSVAVQQQSSNYPKPTSNETSLPTINPTASPTTQPSQPTPTAEASNSYKITLTCETLTSNNLNVTVGGQVTSNGIGVDHEQIILSYSPDAGISRVNLTAITTSSNGYFFYVWTPPASGNYQLKAEIVATSNRIGSSAIQGIAFLPLNEENDLSLTSNSTVTSLSYNSTSQTLYFIVNGTSGTTGYVSINLPKTLVNDSSHLKVYVDGLPVSYDLTQQDNATIVSFNYHHSTHQVTVSLNADNTDSIGFYLILGLSAAAIALFGVILVLVYKKS